MKACEVVRAAAKIISERGWCQGANARDVSGRAVPVLDPSGSRKPNPEAATFSIYGAIMTAGATGDRQTQTGPMWEVLVRQAVANRRDGKRDSRQHPVFEFNDREGQTVEGALEYLADCAEKLDGITETTIPPETPFPAKKEPK